jgi:hypothetical protein
MLYNYEKADKRPDYCKKDPFSITPEEKDLRKAYNNKVHYDVTGSALNIANCPFLAIVDIDINKKLDDSERTAIRNEIIKKIELSRISVGLV